MTCTRNWKKSPKCPKRSNVFKINCSSRSSLCFRAIRASRATSASDTQEILVLWREKQRKCQGGLPELISVTSFRGAVWGRRGAVIDFFFCFWTICSSIKTNKCRSHRGAAWLPLQDRLDVFRKPADQHKERGNVRDEKSSRNHENTQQTQCVHKEEENSTLLTEEMSVLLSLVSRVSDSGSHLLPLLRPLLRPPSSPPSFVLRPPSSASASFCCRADCWLSFPVSPSVQKPETFPFGASEGVRTVVI